MPLSISNLKAKQQLQQVKLNYCCWVTHLSPSSSFLVEAYDYSSRSTNTQTSVDIPPLKGMGLKFLTVERAKINRGR